MIEKLFNAFKTVLSPRPKATDRFVAHAESEVELFAEIGSGRYGVVRTGRRRQSRTEKVGACFAVIVSSSTFRANKTA